MKNTKESNGADYSDDKKYRYILWRIWDKRKPVIMFIGLNPATSNETKDDPTIRRVTQFTKDWGFGGMYMMNLYPRITTNPKDLDLHDNILINDSWLDFYSHFCDKIIFCWGNFKEAKARSIRVTNMFFLNETYILGLNKNGSPKHPLYVKSNTAPMKFLNQ